MYIHHKYKPGVLFVENNRPFFNSRHFDMSLEEINIFIRNAWLFLLQDCGMTRCVVVCQVKMPAMKNAYRNLNHNKKEK